MTKIDDFRLRRFNEVVAVSLDEQRPDRYLVADGTDDDVEDGHADMSWIDDVADSHQSLLPESTARRLFARQIARNIESMNLRRGNKILRDMWDGEQMHVGYLEAARYPVVIVRRMVREGAGPQVVRERVQIREMTSADHRLYAAEGRRAAAKEFETRNRSYRIAEQIADEMDEFGYKKTSQWLHHRYGDEAEEQ